MVILQRGRFQLGSRSWEKTTDPNEPLRDVVINRPFAIASHEATIGDFKRFPGSKDWEEQKNTWVKNKYKGLEKKHFDSDLFPVSCLTWYDAARYCNWLSEQEGIDENRWCYIVDPTGNGVKLRTNFLECEGYRLPTEEEWEFACRSGTITSRYFGHWHEQEDEVEVRDKLLDKYARYGQSPPGSMLKTGTLKPNAWGLFDMLGNAMEWCQDGTRLDQGEVLNANKQIVRGSMCTNLIRHVRAARRIERAPDERDFVCGFRPVRTILDH